MMRNVLKLILPTIPTLECLKWCRGRELFEKQVWNVCRNNDRNRWIPNLWCREQDLNLHAFRHTVLSRARLPIPPSRLHPSMAKL